ncbi:acyl-CoA dehydratase activase [Chloroflexota bacterium]
MTEGNLAVGLDLGSSYSKIVLLEDSRIRVSRQVPSQGSYEDIAQELFQNALGDEGQSLDAIAHAGVTGYAKVSLPVSYQEVENMHCQVAAVHRLLPEVRTIIDIGGLYTRIIKLNEAGKIKDLTLSAPCAAATGKFLEMVAHIIGVDISKLGDLALKAKTPVKFISSCAVFAETEAISRIAEGIAKEDIIAGAYKAVATKAAILAKQIDITPDCTLVGGTGQNAAMVKYLETELGYPLYLAPSPQYIAAIGAAMVASRNS